MATYGQTADHMTRKRTTQLRELLRRDHGAGKYRLTQAGDVHVYGKMPNSIETGWYLLGSRRHVEAEYQL